MSKHVDYIFAFPKVEVELGIPKEFSTSGKPDIPFAVRRLSCNLPVHFGELPFRGDGDPFRESKTITGRYTGAVPEGFVLGAKVPLIITVQGPRL